MAKRKTQIEGLHPKLADNDDIDFAPADRPDQPSMHDADDAETVDFLAKDDDADTHDDESGDEEDTRIVPREKRQRADEDDEAALRQAKEKLERHTRDDDGEYSKKVNRRINREIALRKRSDARLESERTARQQLEQRLANLEQTHQDSKGEETLKGINAQMREVADKLAAAKEAGDTKLEVELQIQLGDLQGNKVRLQAQLDRQKEERAAAKPSAGDERRDSPAESRGRSGDWIRQQKRWWNTARWKDAKTDAITHDTTILGEIEAGELEFEPYSDEHLEELSRRLKTDYPDLEVRTAEGELFEEASADDDDEDDDRRSSMRNRDDDDARQPARKTQQKPAARTARAPMGGLGGREGRRERSDIEMARRGKVTLGDADFQTMRTFKLDPSNPEHKKYFAKERARTLLRGEQRR